MDQLRDIVGLLPPPASPLELPTREDWLKVERNLGFLPSDYKQFIEKYGTGLIDGFIWIFSPSAANEHVNLESQAIAILRGLADSAKQFPGTFDIPMHPEQGGFLPFGGTDNGDNLFWVTNGSPDRWTVAVMDSRSPDVREYECGFLNFLCKLLSREVRCPAFPGDFPSDIPLVFESRGQ